MTIAHTDALLKCQTPIVPIVKEMGVPYVDSSTTRSLAFAQNVHVHLADGSNLLYQ